MLGSFENWGGVDKLMKENLKHLCIIIDFTIRGGLLKYQLF